MTPGPATGRERSSWTTPEAARAVLRQRWDSGALARDHAAGASVAPASVSLRAPGARDLSEDFGRVQAWATAWDDAQRHGWRIERRAVGGRLVGANQLPARAWVDDDETVWRLVGATRDVRALDDVLAQTRRAAPEALTWVVEHPLRAVASASEWAGLLSTARWLADRVGTWVYLREIDLPGIDTKFVERHRVLLSALVDQLVPAQALDTGYGAHQLSRRLRLATKPASIRMRHLEPGRGLVGSLTEVTARVDELRGLRPDGVNRVVILENEITYLALPARPGTLAVLGSGYQAERLGDLPWLADLDVRYWGDLDTHGFAILDRVRRGLPQTRSVLMDRATLLAYRDRWVVEPSPVNAVLPLLTAEEAALYADLVEDTYAPAVRLEQERIPLSAPAHAW